MVERDTVITVAQCGTCEAVRMLELEIMMIVRDVPKRWSMLRAPCLSMKRMERTTENLYVVSLTRFELRWRLLDVCLLFKFYIKCVLCTKWTFGPGLFNDVGYY